MTERGSFLHWSFHDENVLLQGVEISSIWTFFLVSILTSVLCLIERYITFVLNKKRTPSTIFHRSRWRKALYRTSLYWVATIIRLFYMLVSMTYNIILIILIATSLAAGQFVIELLDDPPPTPSDPFVTEPLLNPPPDDQQLPLTPITTRPRSRSKPTQIFIHPQQSNHARADAAAQEMGISGDTELVRANVRPGAKGAWEHGKGRDFARLLMGGRERSEEHLFRIEDDNPDAPDSDSS